MDDRLKQRLIGAVLLVIAALVLVSLLPTPQLRQAADPDVQMVTINLLAPDTPLGAPADALAIEPAVIAVPATPASLAPATPEPAAEGGSPELVPVDAPAFEAETGPAVSTTPAPTTAPTSAPSLDARPTPAPLTSPLPSGSASWWVQVGSFSDIANARLAEQRIRELGQPAVLAPVETPRGTLYRVRGGPYAGEVQAQAAHRVLVDAGYTDARLIKP